MLTFIRQLAAHHGDEATITAARLREDGFGQTRRFTAIVAEDGGEPVGYALWGLAYNAVFGNVVRDLRHLFVADQRRRSGIGRAIIGEVARWAEAEGHHRIRLGVGPQNAPALAFYRSLEFRESPPGFFVDRDQFRRLNPHGPGGDAKP